MSLRRVYAAIAILSCVGFVQAISEVNDRTSTVIEHHNLTVACDVIVQPDIDVYWVKNDTQTKFYQNGTVLDIPDITRDQAGEYVCYTQNKTGGGQGWTEVVEAVMVDVQYPAEVLECSLDKTTIMSNESFSVRYNVVGNPAPEWEIVNNRTHVTLTQASKAAQGVVGPFPVLCGNDGLIMCTGRNLLNTNKFETGTNLTILCPPKQKPADPHRIISHPHAGAFFIMNFVGNPVPNVTWARTDGQPIPWSRTEQLDFDYFTVLNMTDVEVSDFTNYTATLTNIYGTFTTHYVLSAYGRPEVPTDLEFSEVTHDSVRLNWTSGYDMGSRQYFQIYDMGALEAISEQIFDHSSSHGVGEEFTYVVKGLRSNTAYKLSVKSTNSDYSSDYAKPYASFTTNSAPSPPGTPSRHTDTYVIVGCTVGAIGLVAIVAAVVYIVRYRKGRAGYEDMKNVQNS